ncbi:glycosyltransferase family 4 protein [Mediterraneibacter glycyrrhizinilyticus]|uniref:glycosyltransferase family 4 protein n=1 Tax=Mediterraneibacter glycyrrhizinilyticus TaxID=342942 RepID=UPI0025A41823|nr:glycosyltransferase family 4 protein [Mediterraneibacter glycyrrhizinilyticus]MDM8209862.1 glycosyltransferase family 4 protein [Mediterraneibacter glycyrrhizinilyticus]
MSKTKLDQVNKKRLLIYAHYYIPDTASTGQILRELAEGMLEQFDITVICVVPSYLGTVEEKYKTKMFYRENINGVDVLRIRVPEFSKTNTMSRVKNILTYFFGAMIATFKVGKQDYVFSISQPPILGGLLGVWGKWMKHAKFIYNIQDFNPEQVMAVNYSKNKLIIGTMMFLDKFSCRQSNLIITVGRDLVETVQKRFKGKKVPKTVMINNWIDEKEIYPVEQNHPKVVAFKEKYGLSNKFVVMYSGNIGLYYDLENLMKVIEKVKPGTKTADGREVVFAFVGAGSVLDNLVAYKEKKRMDNVIFIPYQDKADLIYSLNTGDVHWCVNAKGIKGVSCPSKYYGIAAAGKSVLAVLEKGSEIRCIVEETEAGLCAEPGDYESVEQNLKRFIENAGTGELIAMGQRSRKNLVQNLTRDVSVRKYMEEISNL